MIALLLVTHFVADFLFQSREMGKKKSSEPKWLFKHLAIQFTFFAAVLMLANVHLGCLFAAANALIHGVIDWNIWRGYKYFVYMRAKLAVKKRTPGLTEEVYHNVTLTELGTGFQYWEDHWFYSTIGFDQLLHGLTLVFLAYAFHLT